MFRIGRRIERLEHALGLSSLARPFVHRINFIDGNGRLTGTMVMSDRPELCIGYQDLEDPT